MSELDAPHIAPTHAPGRRTHPELFAEAAAMPASKQRLWVPRQVLVTRSARNWPLADEVVRRAEALGSRIVELSGDRISGMKDGSPARNYREAKSTLALVVAPPSKLRPQPIPPSADWRFDLATGCPAHCQYCYLAGSLTGPPLTRLFVNLPEIMGALEPAVGQGAVTSRDEARKNEGTTFEASCYTDPLALEPVSGCLSAAIRHFGGWRDDVQLRFTTKFSAVEPLLGLDHRGRTRARFSVNALEITRRFEGGTSSLADRLTAMGLMSRAGYPVGLTIAPIMPVADWQGAYDDLLARAGSEVAPGADLTVELITHRFTPGSRDVLLGWYPATGLEMDPAVRAQKRTKFGSVKFVYPKSLMDELRLTVTRSVERHLPNARILYFT